MKYSTDTLGKGQVALTSDTRFTTPTAAWPGYDHYFLPPSPDAGSVQQYNHWLLQQLYQDSQHQPSAAPYRSHTYYLPVLTSHFTPTPPSACFSSGFGVPLGPAAPPLPASGSFLPTYLPCRTQHLPVTPAIKSEPLHGGIPDAHIQRLKTEDVNTSPEASRRASSPDSGYSSCESPAPPDTTSSLDVFLSSLGPRPPSYKKRLGGKPKAPRCCHLCPKKYTRSQSLTAHLVACHPSTIRPEELTSRRATLTCSVCSKVFSSSSSMRTHMRNHTGEKPFRCDICDKVFADRAVWRRHRRNHCGAKDFVCVVCGFEFSQSANLKRHLVLMHPDTMKKGQ